MPLASLRIRNICLAGASASGIAGCMPHVLIQSDNHGSQKLLLDGDRVTIGRHPESDIVLDDDSVSSRHAELCERDGRWSVRDLQSSNGTTVNGASAFEETLADGDIIRFGGVECVFKDSQDSTTNNQGGPAEQDGQTPSSSSLASRLANLGKAAVAETKRNARLVAIKSKIEKLKRIDLVHAFHTLGRRAYETRVAVEAHAAQYDQIAALEAKIGAKRAGESLAAEATTMDRITHAAGNTKLKAEAELLSISLRQLFVDLGERLMEHPQNALKDETESVRAVTAEIAATEEQFSQLDADRSSGMRRPQWAIVVVSLISVMLATGLAWRAVKRSMRPQIGIIAPNAPAVTSAAAAKGGATPTQKQNSNDDRALDEMMELARESFTEPPMANRATPTFKETINFISNKTSGTYKTQIGYGKKSNRIIVRVFADEDMPLQVLTFDPADMSPEVKVFKITEPWMGIQVEKGSVRVNCTNNAHKVILYRAFAGVDKFNVNLLEFHCNDLGDARQVAKAFSHLVSMFGGRRDTF